MIDSADERRNKYSNTRTQTHSQKQEAPSKFEDENRK